MSILNIKKGLFFPNIFLPLIFLSAGCVCNEEIKNIRVDLQLKEKTIDDLLDRLSAKDQEIGKLTDKLHTATMTIEDLKNDIEQLREVDVQTEEKKKEVDIQIEDVIPGDTPEATTGTETESIMVEEQEK